MWAGSFSPSATATASVPEFQVWRLDYPAFCPDYCFPPAHPFNDSVRAAFIVEKPSHKGLCDYCEEVIQDWQCTHLSWEKICTWQGSISSSVLIEILWERNVHTVNLMSLFPSLIMQLARILFKSSVKTGEKTAPGTVSLQFFSLSLIPSIPWPITFPLPKAMQWAWEELTSY